MIIPLAAMRLVVCVCGAKRIVARDTNNELAVNEHDGAFANRRLRPHWEGGDVCTTSLNGIVEEGARKHGIFEAGSAQVLAAEVDAGQVDAVEDRAAQVVEGGEAQV